jgi:hypothetical protein
MGLDSVAVRGPAGVWDTLDPCEVEANAVITHGRAGVGAAPTASSCALTIITDALPGWAVADEITVSADGRQRFAGRITDLTLTHTTPGTTRAAVIAVTAIGVLADLGWRDVGGAPWPEESTADRARSILADSDVPYRVEGDPPLKVIPRDVDRARALDLITRLAEDSGAAVFDTPDGAVVFQHYAARAQTWTYRLWREAPGIWSEQDQWFTDWAATAATSPTAPAPVDLPCDVAAWEPVWGQTAGQVINHVTIGYGIVPAGGSQAEWTISDAGSVARYGRQHYGKQTELADQPSAAYRAGLIIDRNDTPRWGMTGLDVYPAEMDPALAARVLALTCGDRVNVLGLPQPAPDIDVVAVVEGWTHTINPAGDVLTLNLSDPLHSYAGVIWAAIDPAGRWQDCPPALAWFDALTDPTRKVTP